MLFLNLMIEFGCIQGRKDFQPFGDLSCSLEGMIHSKFLNELTTRLINWNFHMSIM